MTQRQKIRHLGAWANAAIFGALAVGWAAQASAGPPAAAPAKASAPAVAKITEEQATAIALKALPGKVTGVTIEKKRGKRVYAVEIMSPTKGEKDVYVDTVTGKVVGID